MEPVGFAAGIVALASLFSTCIECWNYVDTARSYGRDYEILATKLEIEKTRFLIWGDAIGILKTAEEGRDAALDSQQIAQVVQRILNCIIAIFTDSEALVARYGLQKMQPGEFSAKGSTLSTNQLSKFKASYRQFQARIEHEQNNTTLLAKARWAIKDRNKFTDLVDEVRQFIDSLKDITESLGGNLTQRQRAAIEEEIESLPDVRSIKLVKDASKNVHADWSDAATQALEMSILGREDKEDILKWITDTDDTEVYRQAALETLSDAGLDITMGGFEILHWAAMKGHEHVVLFLLDQGVDVDARDGQRRTALLHAIESGQTGVVHCLIKRGANVEAQQLGESRLTPLLLAVRYRNRDIVSLLVKNGAIIDIRDGEWCTPLIRAAQAGDVDIIEVLLAHGANVEARRKNGATALNDAAWWKRAEAVKLLLRSGANLECVLMDHNTPLIQASEHGHEEIARILLEHGANTNACDKNGRTALILAVRRGSLNMVQALLENGANVEALYKHFHETPLLEAAVQQGSAKLIRLLVKYGANVNAVSSTGSTALMRAAQRGDLENVEALVDSGVPLDVQDVYGGTAIMWAVHAGKRAVVHFLASRGADLKLFDHVGNTILHCAAHHGHFEITKDVINLGIDIDQRTNAGSTALFNAAQNGYYELVKLLLEQGASKKIMDHAGETPMMVALRNGDRTIANLLS